MKLPNPKPKVKNHNFNVGSQVEWLGGNGEVIAGSIKKFLGKRQAAIDVDGGLAVVDIEKLKHATAPAPDPEPFSSQTIIGNSEDADSITQTPLSPKPTPETATEAQLRAFAQEYRQLFETWIKAQSPP